MDVVTLNCPLHPETEHMVNSETIKLFKRGAYLVNTARGKLCDRDVIAKALEDGQLAGYAGDVWFPQVSFVFVFFLHVNIFVFTLTSLPFRSLHPLATPGGTCPGTE